MLIKFTKEELIEINRIKKLATIGERIKAKNEFKFQHKRKMFVKRFNKY